MAHTCVQCGSDIGGARSCPKCGEVSPYQDESNLAQPTAHQQPSNYYRVPVLPQPTSANPLLLVSGIVLILIGLYCAIDSVLNETGYDLLHFGQSKISFNTMLFYYIGFFVFIVVTCCVCIVVVCTGVFALLLSRKPNWAIAGIVLGTCVGCIILICDISLFSTIGSNLSAHANTFLETEGYLFFGLLPVNYLVYLTFMTFLQVVVLAALATIITISVKNVHILCWMRYASAIAHRQVQYP